MKIIASGGIVQYFNPRSREGSDRIGLLQGSRKMHFNPRSREGSDENVL